MKPGIKTRITALTVLLTICYLTPGIAQQDNTLFYMHKIPQSNFANPAVISECKFHIGGFIVPVTGQILAPVYINYSNSSFAFSDVIFYGTGDYSDSLIHPLHENAYQSGKYDDFMNKQRDKNFINFDFNINLLNAGLKIKDWYFTLNVTEKADFRFEFSKDLIHFLARGNEDAYGRTLDMRYNLQVKHYREYMIGAARPFTEDLVLGAHFKCLFGKSNIQMRDNYLRLYTDPIYWTWSLQANNDLSVSMPAFDVTDFHIDYEKDSFAFDIDSTKLPLNDSLDISFSELDPKGYMLNRKNFGFGIDLGGIYKVTDRLKIHASLLDVGFIYWRTNPETFTSAGTYHFEGIDVNPYITNSDTNYIDEVLKDSLIRIFEPVNSGKPYATSLTPKFYLGATYKLHDLITVGILYRSLLYDRDIHSSLTISGVSDIKHWLSASLSYSVNNNHFANIGMGLYIRGSFFQFFLVTDNILAAFFPDRTRNINFRMGCNMAFGCYHKTESTMF
ncbi:MAG: hypothetical protein KJ607_08680 [Bacteroidetes bacterium]|nr:hypothetical protein [Bacteroidota bacterium]